MQREGVGTDQGLAHIHAKRSHFRNPELQWLSNLFEGQSGCKGEKLIFSHLPRATWDSQHCKDLLSSQGCSEGIMTLHLILGASKPSGGRHLCGFLSKVPAQTHSADERGAVSARTISMQSTQ